MNRTTLETHSGRFFDFSNPDPNEVSIEDIAHALGHVCRYGGHCSRFYSVAEHAMVVRQLVIDAGRPDLSLAALHHDSHEAFLGDIPTPLKRKIDEADGAYTEMADRLDGAIAAAFSIDPDKFEDRVLHEADEYALRIEAAVLKRSQGVQGSWPYRELPTLPGWFDPGMDPDEATFRFHVTHMKEVTQ